MRRVVISDKVASEMAELDKFLTQGYALSRAAANARMTRMDDFVALLAGAVDYPLCRFRHWRALGYHCAVFEKNWIFAYEIFAEGIIVRDMAHTSILAEII